MKTLSAVLLAALLTALPSSCKSSGSDADLPCRCGTALADLEGCDHPLCRAGRHNPDNADCVCGSIEIPSGKKE